MPGARLAVLLTLHVLQGWRLAGQVDVAHRALEDVAWVTLDNDSFF